MPSFDIFYMRPDFFRDGIMGPKWCRDCGKLPKPTALAETHVYLKQIEADSLEDVFEKMQGDNWSPNGEANELIQSKGLRHTSMSVGDIIVNQEGECWMADVVGFEKLN